MGLFWRRVGPVTLLGAAVTIGGIGLKRAGGAGADTRTDARAATSRSADVADATLGAATTDGTGRTTIVRRGSLTLSLDLNGIFEPVAMQEVRIRVKRYQGELTIRKIVSQDSKVTKGDVLLELDTEKVDLQIAAAENDLKTAQANLAKAESDVALGRTGDALAMANMKNELANAHTALDRWDGIDGETFALSAGMQAKISDFYVENASDELDQLHKMYKSEDLTSDTADIVLKRATKTLGFEQILGKIAHVASDRLTQVQAAMTRQHLAADVDDAALSVAQLEAMQTQSAVVRDSSTERSWPKRAMP